jgi:hypothetical protein
MKPCIYCNQPIPKEIFEQELGMCISCSNLFFEHVINPYDPTTFPKNGKANV